MSSSFVAALVLLMNASRADVHAPSLAEANVGVAMGSGTDVARESADVVLLGNDLLKFAETLSIARRTRRIIWQNFVGTIGVDAVGMALAAIGLLNPLLAAFIHVASELTFILNSARLLPPGGRAWEHARHKSYQAYLAGRTVGEVFETVADFLELTATTALAAAGISPSDAAVSAIPELGPGAVSRFVLRRLARLSDTARSVAESVAVLGDVEPIDLTSMNSWEDAAFVAAVKATGRKKLVMVALWTEVCLAFPTLDALREGFEVYPVVDAVGGTSI